MNFTNQSDVTVVLTSCNRPTLLAETLSSFDKFNTYPLHSFIIIEDSGVKGCNDKLKAQYPFINWIDNEVNIGQWASIDKAYSFVETKYIFHCEDDWRFYDYGFIEESRKVLEHNPNIITVSIREHGNFNIIKKPFSTGTAHYLFKPNGSLFKSLTFNCGLRRLSDYKLLAPYCQYYIYEYPYMAEDIISDLYFRLGKIAAMLKPSGYVKHIGGKSHVTKTEQPKRGLIIIPYRDRQQHLQTIIPILTKYGIDIVVVEQADNKPFNRAKLFNIGYLENKGYDYIICHDVDLIPKDADYSYHPTTCHISSRISTWKYKLPYADNYGGVTLFNSKVFELVNGFSNEYFGWGGEDDDMLLRVKRNNIPYYHRPCIFDALPHRHNKEATTYNNNTRILQSVIDKQHDTLADGLNNCTYNVISVKKTNYKHIKVTL